MAKRTLSHATQLLSDVAKFAESDPGRDNKTFLSVLRSNFPGLDIHVFETKGRRITPVESPIDIEKFADEIDVNTCLSDRHEVEIGSGSKSTLLVPVLVNNSASMLVVAKRRPRRRVNIEEFVTLIRVYGNVLSIVQASERDTLTGLFNRRMLDRRLPEMMSGLRSPRRRTTDPVSAHVAILDIDRFKRINDKHGHLYGDEVLLLFGGLMKQSFRSSDLLIRYGGEEFVVVLTDTTLANCEMVLDRFREKVESYWFPNIGHVTISIGAARIGKQVLPVTVLDQTDQALYYAKGSGRNRVCIYDNLVKQGHIKVHAPTDDAHRMFDEKRQLSTRGKSVSRDRRAGRAQAN
jgi:diguanylate cyclase (GGDEF)-like protein